MSILKSIFGGKPKAASPSFVNPVTTELHSHLIPNIDDGVQSLEESIAVLKQFEAKKY